MAIVRTWIVQDRYEWLWLYAAVEAKDTGASCCLYLLVSGHRLFLQRFIDELSPELLTDDFLLLVMAFEAGLAHRSQTMVWPEHIKPLLLAALYVPS